MNSEKAKNLLGPGCGWLSLDLNNDVSFRIETVRREKAADGLKGLDATYDAKEIGSIDYLKPITLEGHPGNPAVIAGQQERIAEGECAIHIGLADDLVLSLLTDDEANPENACVMGQRLATVVLDTMKKGA